MTLSHRAEQAKPEETRGLVEELWRRIGEYEWEDGTVWRQLLDIDTPEAHLAATMMLVPDGWKWRIMPADSRTAWLVEVWQNDDEDGEFGARGVTPALAMIAAIARSQGL